MPYLTPDSAPDDYICRVLKIPRRADWLSLVGGALASLCFYSNWEQSGDQTPEETAAVFKQMLLEFYDSEACMIGVILPMATGAVKSNMLPCDGTVYNRVDYQKLYAELDSQYIIDANTFRVPDLRKRYPRGYDPEDMTIYMGGQGGEEAHAQTIAELASHDHTTEPHTHTDLGHTHLESIAIPSIINGGLEAPASAAQPGANSTGVGFANIDSASVSINTSGEGEPFNVLDPFEFVRYGIIFK